MKPENIMSRTSLQRDFQTLSSIITLNVIARSILARKVSTEYNLQAIQKYHSCITHPFFLLVCIQIKTSGNGGDSVEESITQEDVLNSY